VDWVYVVWNRDRWRTFVNMVINFWGFIKGKKLLDWLSNCQVIKDCAH
jgi:hypothetical protein